MVFDWIIVMCNGECEGEYFVCDLLVDLLVVKMIGCECMFEML